jgi:hypothetical protein
MVFLSRDSGQSLLPSQSPAVSAKDENQGALYKGLRLKVPLTGRPLAGRNHQNSSEIIIYPSARPLRMIMAHSTESRKMWDYQFFAYWCYRFSYFG